MAMLVLHPCVLNRTDLLGSSTSTYNPCGRDGRRQDAEGWTFGPPLGTLQAPVCCRPYQQDLRL